MAGTAIPTKRQLSFLKEGEKRQCRNRHSMCISPEDRNDWFPVVKKNQGSLYHTLPAWGAGGGRKKVWVLVLSSTLILDPLVLLGGKILLGEMETGGVRPVLGVGPRTPRAQHLFPSHPPCCAFGPSGCGARVSILCSPAPWGASLPLLPPACLPRLGGRWLSLVRTGSGLADGLADGLGPPGQAREAWRGEPRAQTREGELWVQRNAPTQRVHRSQSRASYAP